MLITRCATSGRVTNTFALTSFLSVYEIPRSTMGFAIRIARSTTSFGSLLARLACIGEPSFELRFSAASEEHRVQIMQRLAPLAIED